MHGLIILRNKKMVTTHTIETIYFDQNFIYLKIDGQAVKAPLELVSLKLKNANETERNQYRISPSGYGIHWSMIDEDISIEGLLKIAGNA